jgi:hypothetical protein
MRKCGWPRACAEKKMTRTMMVKQRMKKDEKGMIF